jgi:hypothetical protein
MTVSGQVTDDYSGVSTVSINGTAVAVSEDGLFSSEILIEEGLNAITVSAEDADGNADDMSVSVIAGEFVPVETPMPFATVVQLNDEIINMMSGPMANAFQDRELVNGGIDKTVWSDCAVMEGTIDTIVVNGASVSINPGSNVVNVAYTFGPTTGTMSGDADLCGIEEPFTVSFSHDAPQYSAALSLSVVDGEIVAEVSESDVSFSGAMVSSDIDVYLDEHGISIYDMGIEDAIADVMDDVISNTLPQQFPNALATIIPDDIGVAGLGDADIGYEPSRLRSSESGIAIAFGTSMEVTEEPVISGPGALSYNHNRFTRDIDSSMASFITTSLINRAMHSGWERGILSTMINAEDKGMTITTFPTMPPVLSNGETAVLRLGEVHMTVHNGESNVGRITVQASADISFETDDSGTPVMVANITSMERDTLTGSVPAELEAELEEAIQATFDAALPSINNLQTQTVELESIGTTVNGSASDWIHTGYLASEK